jgi:hypothetical protein
MLNYAAGNGPKPGPCRMIAARRPDNRYNVFFGEFHNYISRRADFGEKPSFDPLGAENLRRVIQNRFGLPGHSPAILFTSLTAFRSLLICFANRPGKFRGDA